MAPTSLLRELEASCANYQPTAAQQGVERGRGIARFEWQAFFFFTLYVNLIITGLLFLTVAWQTFVPNDPPAA